MLAQTCPTKKERKRRFITAGPKLAKKLCRRDRSVQRPFFFVALVALPLALFRRTVATWEGVRFFYNRFCYLCSLSACVALGGPGLEGAVESYIAERV